jgi:hypothetical protein
VESEVNESTGADGRRMMIRMLNELNKDIQKQLKRTWMKTQEDTETKK